MKNKIKTIGVMTSGGDAPGMNAAIRAVVRTAINAGLRVLAISGGYEGMIEGDFKEMDAGSVSNIIHKGGTIIKTSRSARFLEKKWRQIAFKQLKKAKIDAVIIIGGNGSLSGANAFTAEFNIPFIGVPKTIDNDIVGTDLAIGFDTATNTALDAIDKIRDTANSHHRLFFVEVMGRDLGFIALYSGIAAGAEAILVPECKTNMDDLFSRLEQGWKRCKSSMIVVVAEGAVEGGVMEIANKVKAKFDHYEIRVTILGYIQRGGNPSCVDRVLASRLGNEAVKILLEGKQNVMVGLKNNRMSYTSFSKASSGKNKINTSLLDIANELSL
jgi:6-phosphofructokinase 1